MTGNWTLGAITGTTGENLRKVGDNLTTLENQVRELHLEFAQIAQMKNRDNQPEEGALWRSRTDHLFKALQSLGTARIQIITITDEGG